MYTIMFYPLLCPLLTHTHFLSMRSNTVLLLLFVLCVAAVMKQYCIDLNIFSPSLRYRQRISDSAAAATAMDY